ncbi:hypothetical protein [Streptomyces thioluteus]|uniref:hypothetical protein n=1 Tax=Streptomyces thioluteus TaxID=66431 RepID=UPI0031E9407F
MYVTAVDVWGTRAGLGCGRRDLVTSIHGRRSPRPSARPAVDRPASRAAVPAHGTRRLGFGSLNEGISVKPHPAGNRGPVPGQQPQSR